MAQLLIYSGYTLKSLSGFGQLLRDKCINRNKKENVWPFSNAYFTPQYVILMFAKLLLREKLLPMKVVFLGLLFYQLLDKLDQNRNTMSKGYMVVWKGVKSDCEIQIFFVRQIEMHGSVDEKRKEKHGLAILCCRHTTVGKKIAHPRLLNIPKKT